MKRWLSIVAMVAILAMAVPVSAGNNGNGNGPGLSKHDRALLAEARANGQSMVTLLIASAPGSNRQVNNGLAGLGGAVKYRDDDLGYIRVSVPVNMVEKAAALPGVEAANLDELVPMDDPRPEAEGGVEAVPAPDASTPPLNPYMPTQDIGAPQFVAANPTYDGRGVKIGILDSGVDLFSPPLQTAKLLDGTPTRKVIDFVSFTTPDQDPSWVNMQTKVTSSGGAVTFMGEPYTVPSDGTYQIGVLDENLFPVSGDDLGGDLNRNGTHTDRFGVLWNTATNMVWVDTNMNHSFADEMAMTDYKVNYDIGTLGTDNPATAVRESLAFTIQTDGPNKMVSIGVTSSEHGTHVAGIAAGKGLFGGAVNGAAPEAQIVAVRVCLFTSSCSSSAMIEGMIYAAKQANVDVINMSVGGLPALNDGSSARALLYNRLIEQYKVQMFISAGNSGPGMNTVGDPSIATKVMSVGAYVTKNSWMYNYGANATRNEGMFVFSSRGPREDGGFKPDIIAPGSAVSTVPGWAKPAGVAETGYVPPAGYDMFNGTSMAAPEATGGAALLISAAKQAGAQYKPDQLRQAIKSSARFIAGADAHEQGAGLFSVPDAWNLLRQNIKTVEISSSAPVNTILSDLLGTPDAGPGIYLREGVKPGESTTATVTFTRTSGGSKPITYNLFWTGNDGTFSGPSSVALSLNKPTSISVTVAPAAPGIHSALLNLDDPATTGIDYQTMNTVIAVNDFNGPDFTISYAGSADRPNMSTYFFRVPQGTPAFRVDVTGINGRVRMLRFHPYGVQYDNPTPGYQTGGTISRTIANPTPGVWEVTVDTSRTSLVAPATFTVTGTIFGASVSPATWVTEGAAVGTAYNQSYTFTNLYGAFTGGASGTALGSAFAAVPTVAAGGAQQTYDINVLPGSTSLTVQIGSTSDPGADLDLYLYNCTSGTCVAAGQSADGDSEEAVTVANPAAGHWMALVDPYSVPTGSTTYNYQDVFANPMYGSITVADSSAAHPAGSSWTADASVTAAAAPEAGRYLQGFVQVKAGSLVLGSGLVQLKF